MDQIFIRELGFENFEIVICGTDRFARLHYVSNGELSFWFQHYSTIPRGESIRFSFILEKMQSHENNNHIQNF